MRAILLVVAAIAAGCAAPLPTVTAADASRTGVELAELQHGRDMLVEKCSGCHRTPQPAQHVASEWPAKLDEMAQRSHLDFDQRRAIEAYLVALAR
jgi:hypothetical protein